MATRSQKLHFVVLLVCMRCFQCNIAPSFIYLSKQTWDEAQPTGSQLAKMSTFDIDRNDKHTYTMTRIPTVEIQGDALYATTTALDYETANTLTLRLTSTDDGVPPLSVTYTYPVTITDVNEPPTALTSSQYVIDGEKLNVGATFATLQVNHADFSPTWLSCTCAGF